MVSLPSKNFKNYWLVSRLSYCFVSKFAVHGVAIQLLENMNINGLGKLNQLAHKKGLSTETACFNTELYSPVI